MPADPDRLDDALLRRLAGMHGLVVRCAWCGRIELDGAFVAVGELPEQMKQRATHGICPDCLEREQRTSAAARAAGDA